MRRRSAELRRQRGKGNALETHGSRNGWLVDSVNRRSSVGRARVEKHADKGFFFIRESGDKAGILRVRRVEEEKEG